MSNHSGNKQPKQGQTIDIKSVLSLVEQDMLAVNKTISSQLNSEVALINQLAAYIVQAGGKRLRPVALLLAIKACNKGKQFDPQAQQNHALLAAIIEFIHTATLLHDDVVDESSLRRGKETANEVWGNAASVLVGDYLYSRSFQMMVNINNMRIMDVLSHTTNQIAEGEVMQLVNCGSAETTQEQYMQTIQSKTAILFKAATQLAAIISDQDAKTEQALADYGLHLGTAFQLVDDVLDYTAQAEQMGKNIGDDLAEGKPTLPIIHAISKASGTDKQLLCEAISNANRDNLQRVLSIMDKHNSLQYTAECAQQQAQLAQQCLNHLPDSNYKSALIDLAQFSVQRSS